MSKLYPGVYRIVNLANGKCYIGSSAYLHSRKSDHFQDLRDGKHVNIHLQRAWNRDGEEAFLFEVLERCPKEILVEREQYWIDALEPAYNIRKVAKSNLGLKRSEATKVKARLRWLDLSPEEQEQARQTLAEGRRKHLEAIANGEWQHSPEAIEAIKAARAKQEMTPAMLEALKQGQEIRKQVNPKPRLGMKNSEETRRRQSEAAKQRPPISEETRRRQSESHQGYKPSEEAIRKTAEANKERIVSEATRNQIAETNRATWAKKTAEEKHSYTQKRPPVSEKTRQRQSEAAKHRRNKAL